MAPNIGKIQVTFKSREDAIQFGSKCAEKLDPNFGNSNFQDSVVKSAGGDITFGFFVGCQIRIRDGQERGTINLELQPLNPTRWNYLSDQISAPLLAKLPEWKRSGIIVDYDSWDNLGNKIKKTRDQDPELRRT